MGGFVTGLAGAIGQKIQEHNERNIHYQHQAQEEQAQQYDRMAENAERDKNYELATDLHKASFGIRTTMPGQKPKKIRIQGADVDPLDMQTIFRKHVELQNQRNAQQPQPVQPLAPNGATPQQPPQPGGAFQPPAQLTPPPQMQGSGQSSGGSSPDDPGSNDPFGIRK